MMLIVVQKLISWFEEAQATELTMLHSHYFCKVEIIAWIGMIACLHVGPFLWLPKDLRRADTRAKRGIKERMRTVDPTMVGP